MRVRDKANVGEISGMYTPVHEHFEATLNAVSCRMRLFNKLLVRHRINDVVNSKAVRE